MSYITGSVIQASDFNLLASVTGTPLNVVINGDFETGTLDSWTSTVQGSSALESSDVISGSYSLRFNGGATTPRRDLTYSDYVDNVKPGHFIKVTFVARRGEGANLPDADLRCRVRYQEPGGTNYHSFGASVSAQANTEGNQELTIETVAPDGVGGVHLSFDCPNLSTGYWLIDDVSLFIVGDKAGHLWGVGGGDRGYGQSTPTLVTNSSNLIIPSWANLQTILSNLCEWQDSSTTHLPGATNFARGAIITAFGKQIPLVDPGFESGTWSGSSNIPSDENIWSTPGAVSGTTYTVTDNDSHSGIYSMHVDTGSTAGTRRLAMKAIDHRSDLAGRVVQAKGWIKRLSGSGGTNAIRVQWRNSSNSSEGAVNGSSITEVGDWQQSVLTATIPANVTRVDIEFVTSAVDSEFLFDDCEIMISPSIPSLLEILDENRLNYQIENMTLTTNVASSTRTSPWGGGTSSISCEFSVTFEDENSARYFFNTGGEIRLALDHPDTSTQQDTNWNNILDDLVVAFRAHTTTRLSGSTGHGYNGEDGYDSRGYYELTTTYQTVYDGINSGTGSYSTNDYHVEAKANSITSENGAKGSEIWFRVTLTDQHTNEFFDEVKGGTNVTLSHLRATGAPLESPIAAPICVVENSFNDEIEISIGSISTFSYTALQENDSADISVTIPNGCKGLLVAVATGSSATDTSQDFITLTLDPNGGDEVSTSTPVVRTGTFNISKFLLFEKDQLPPPGTYTLRAEHTNLEGAETFILGAAFPLICDRDVEVRQTAGTSPTNTTQVTNSFTEEIASGSLVVQVVNGGNHNTTMTFNDLANEVIDEWDTPGGANTAAVAYEIDPSEDQSFQVTCSGTQNRFAAAAVEIAIT